tara:strand:+ start:5730 stop:6173 length:444 start_codon:yes stop_codon:yes gene_type:complete
MGFRPTSRTMMPDFTEPHYVGMQDSGIPARQERIDFEFDSEYEVFKSVPLDEFLAKENPRMSQLKFIGTNLPNEFDYPVPREAVGSLQKIPALSGNTPALFGRNRLDPVPFNWNSPMVFETDRFGASHDFNQTRPDPMVSTYGRRGQ